MSQLRYEKPQGKFCMDITGQKFNMLTAIKFWGVEDGKSYWWFLCDCGTKFIAKGVSVKTGATKSCGCIRKSITHTKTYDFNPNTDRLYKVWANKRHACRRMAKKKADRFHSMTDGTTIKYLENGQWKTGTTRRTGKHRWTGLTEKVTLHQRIAFL